MILGADLYKVNLLISFFFTFEISFLYESLTETLFGYSLDFKWWQASHFAASIAVSQNNF